MNFKPLDLFDVFGVADIPRDASFEGNGGGRVTNTELSVLIGSAQDCRNSTHISGVL